MGPTAETINRTTQPAASCQMCLEIIGLQPQAAP